MSRTDGARRKEAIISHNLLCVYEVSCVVVCVCAVKRGTASCVSDEQQVINPHTESSGQRRFTVSRAKCPVTGERRAVGGTHFSVHFTLNNMDIIHRDMTEVFKVKI